MALNVALGGPKTRKKYGWMLSERKIAREKAVLREAAAAEAEAKEIAEMEAALEEATDEEDDAAIEAAEAEAREIAEMEAALEEATDEEDEAEAREIAEMEAALEEAESMEAHEDAQSEQEQQQPPPPQLTVNWDELEKVMGLSREQLKAMGIGQSIIDVTPQKCSKSASTPSDDGALDSTFSSGENADNELMATTNSADNTRDNDEDKESLWGGESVEDDEDEEKPLDYFAILSHLPDSDDEEDCIDSGLEIIEDPSPSRVPDEQSIVARRKFIQSLAEREGGQCADQSDDEDVSTTASEEDSDPNPPQIETENNPHQLPYQEQPQELEELDEGAVSDVESIISEEE